MSERGRNEREVETRTLVLQLGRLELHAEIMRPEAVVMVNLPIIQSQEPHRTSGAAYTQLKVHMVYINMGLLRTWPSSPLKVKTN